MGARQEAREVQATGTAMVEMEPAELGNCYRSCSSRSSRCHKGRLRALDSQSKSAPKQTNNMCLEVRVGTVLAVWERESGSALVGPAWETGLAGLAVELASAQVAAEPVSVMGSALVLETVACRP